jgi:hypothetical protein
VTDDLLRAALATYPFRAPHPHEDAETYRAEAVRHLESHDWALAHEVRLGKPQAAWTADDVAAFERRIRGFASAHEFTPGVHVFPTMESGPYPVTDAGLLSLADEQLQILVEMRLEHPTKPIPIVASVLLTTGTVLTCLTARDERIAILKALAQDMPVFGFVMTFDAFMHAITDGARATKVDTILQHVGTRDVRLVRRRPYRVDGSRAIFDAGPPADLDARDPAVSLRDPYAAIFVSVPSMAGPPS